METISVVLREYIHERIAELEKLMSARIDAVSDRLEIYNASGNAAIEARLANTIREVNIIHTASDKAISKAEEATEKRFDSVNEWRAQSLDRERSMSAQLQSYIDTLMPRPEAEAKIQASSEKVIELASRLDKNRRPQRRVECRVGLPYRRGEFGCDYNFSFHIAQLRVWHEG